MPNITLNKLFLTQDWARVFVNTWQGTPRPKNNKIREIPPTLFEITWSDNKVSVCCMSWDEQGNAMLEKFSPDDDIPKFSADSELWHLMINGKYPALKAVLEKKAQYSGLFKIGARLCNGFDAIAKIAIKINSQC